MFIASSDMTELSDKNGRRERPFLVPVKLRNGY